MFSVTRHSPSYQAVTLQSPQPREQRSRIDPESPIADLFEANADAVAVERFERQRLQDQHVQRALDEATRAPYQQSSLLQTN